jgi:hypothetical protein
MKAFVVIALLAACSSSSKPANIPIANVAPATPAEAEGVELVTKVVDSVSEWPIEGAVVRVIPTTVTVEPLDPVRLDGLAVTRATSDVKGVARFTPRIPPGTYSVVVIADRYHVLIGESELVVTPGTASPFDPWGHISLRLR